ncbi:hypothetical protein TNCV_4942131 [Trichonephila clavipes]|nr:hypothetical protein TNCV_4942131 [Trichonephila clavipes]
MPLKCRIGPLVAAPPDTCAVVISTETESGFITEDDTFQSVTLQVARGRQKFDTAYDVGSVVSVLADVGSSSQLRSVVSFMVSLDGTGCLEGGDDLSLENESRLSSLEGRAIEVT